MNLNISALEFVQEAKLGNISVEDFVAETIQRIRDVDDTLHAFLSLSGYDDAISQAQGIDRKIRSGQHVGACFGMPISIKDNICIKDSKTTCASRMLEDFVAPYDATVITRLRDSDAVFIGKTNMDEFAMGITTEFSAFGPSRNPWNTKYVPGGSSGGSAVSVAALECVASLGSDTGGSVRNPASFCSVVGYKPTYGLVSRYGLISYANSIEQIGPITRTVKDAAFMLNIISGLDPNDDTTAAATAMCCSRDRCDAGHDGSSNNHNHNHNNNNTSNTSYDYLSGIDADITSKRIGIISDMMGDGIDAAVLSATRDAISKLEGLGATCQEISLDMIKYSVAAYYTITSTEAGSNLARYDNIRYGYDLPLEGYEFNSYITKARDKFGPEVRRRIILGGFVPSAGHAGRYFLKALKVKQKLTEEINRAFQDFDVLIAPTVPILPFCLGEKIDDPLSLFLLDINTVTANLTGKPSISVPYTHSHGLPIGIQLIADSMQDGMLLQVANALEGTTNLPEVPI